MKDFLRRKWQVILYFILLFLSSVLILTTVGHGENNKFDMERGVQMADDWSYDMLNGKTGKTKLPAMLPDTDTGKMILSNVLPNIQNDMSFFFKARHTNVRIIIGDEVVYDQLSKTHEKDTWLNMPGSVYVEVPISRSDSGKTIVIESYGSIKRYLINQGHTFLGDRDSFFLSIWNSKFISILCAFALLIFAIALLIAWIIVTYVAHLRFNEGLCLSLFTLSIALWLFTETQFNQFMFKNTSFITVTAYEILMLTPVPIVLLFSYGGRPKKIKRAAIIAAVIPMGVWIINNTLHLLGIVCLGHTLKFTQAMLFVDVFFIAGIQFADIIHIRSRKNEYRGVFWEVPLVGVSILLPLAIIELLKYMFTINKYPNDGILITIGIMCYILALSVDSGLRVYYANINIKAASEEKTRFLTNMSHDLRTPLNAILGFNEMILRESQDDKITSYSSSIQSAGDSMKEIINSILDISKIESGKLEIYSVEYNTIQLLDNVISITEAIAQKKGLTFIADIDGNLPEVLIGDEIHIRQILLNILNNAVKYTDKGTVTFTVKILES